MFSKKSSNILISLSLVFLLLILFSFTAFAAQKKTVAVAAFDNLSEVNDDVINGQAIASFLRAELAKNKNYQMVGREKDLEAILSEQRLGATGAVNSKTAAKLGNLTGANYIIKGQILQATMDHSGAGLGSMFGIRQQDITVVLNLTFIDTTTGEITPIDNVVGKSDQTSFALNDDSGRNIVAVAQNKQSVYKVAAFEAIKKAAEKIEEINPLEGYIVSIEGKRVYIDLGRSAGVTKGQKFQIFREGQVIKHPVTGKIIGVKKDQFGTIKIIEVDESMAIAEAESGTLTSILKVGDRVKRVKQ